MNISLNWFRFTAIFAALVIVAGLSLSITGEAQAKSPGCSSPIYNADGSISQSCADTTPGGPGGPGSDGSGSSGQNVNTSSCTPGTSVTPQTAYIAGIFGRGPNVCTAVVGLFDDCTGQMVAFGATAGSVDCDDLDSGTGIPPEPPNPCSTLIVTPGGITCSGTPWGIEARVAFPPVTLDVRPFPATLVRWPTAIRLSSMPSASGSDGIGYIGNGGGTSGNPAVGDWRDLTLTLTLRPANDFVVVNLPNLDPMTVRLTSPTSPPDIFHWEVPSHPAAGGGPLAGTIPGLDELPADMPVFVGSARSPYRLFWQLTYEVRDSQRTCVPGRNVSTWTYECAVDGGIGTWDGHYKVEYGWSGYSQGGEVHPYQVVNLPANLLADSNGDGVIDAYWNYNLVLQRMNDNDRTNDPVYARSWNWNGTIYWGVREGQGQIGYPGVP